MSNHKMMTIVVNGEQRTVQDCANLLELLAALGIEADRVAVELNRQIVRKTAWTITPVASGANLEIVQFVGGG